MLALTKQKRTRKMTLTKEQVISKVQKLLNLGNDSGAFAGESSNAMNMARDLLAKHNMSMSDIVIEEEEVECKGGHGVAFGGWQRALARAVSDFTSCKMLLSSKMNLKTMRRKSEIQFVGMPLELEVCLFLYASIAHQIKVHQRRSKDKFKKANPFADRSRVQNYTTGYAAGIVTYLQEEFNKRLSAEVSETALVLVTNPKVDEYMDSITGTKKFSSRSGSDAGKIAGYKDGNKIQIQQGLNGSGTNAQLGD